MQHPKKITRTTKITTHTSNEEESAVHGRRIDRRSPSINSKQKQRQSQSMKKSTCSLQFSKSSNESPLIKNVSKLSKHESIELTLNEQQLKIHKELNELKKMQLSAGLRDRLFKLQRYDKNYKKGSQKYLGQALSEQLMRLQRIRSLDKDMTMTLSDTELLIKCLINERSLLSEVEKQYSDEIQQLLKVKSEMEQNTSFASRNSSRQFINLSSQELNTPVKGRSQKDIPKELELTISFSLRALVNRQYPEAKVEISKFIEKAKKERGHEFYVKMMSQMETMADELEHDGKTIRVFEEEISKLTKNLELSNKYVRENRWSDLERLNMKLSQVKGPKPEISLTLLLESVIENNKVRMKELNSRSRQKIMPMSPDKLKGAELQNMHKELAKSGEEVKQWKRKMQKLEQERVVEKMQLAKLRNSIDKQRITGSIKAAQQKLGVGVSSSREVKLEEQKRSLESKTRSLEPSKKNQEERLQMLEKKNKALELSLKASTSELKQTVNRLRLKQKQLNEVLGKLRKIEERDKRKSESNQMSQTPEKVSLEELRILQNDFNQLSRQKQEEEEKLMKQLEVKELKIRQLEVRLGSFDVLLIEGKGSSDELMRMELEQKDKELIHIKKQLIQSLESQHIAKVGLGKTPQKKSHQRQPQSNGHKKIASPLQCLSVQIMQIREQKHEQTLRQGFSIQFNNIQRQQWRQVSKKLKEYKKKHPSDQFIGYLEQKHRHQFELTEKLTDYQEKLLAIHNELYRLKSVLSSAELINVKGQNLNGRSESGSKRGESGSKRSGSGSGSKAGVKSQQTQLKWWENVQLIHVKEKTEFAKLFNDLINQIVHFFAKNPHLNTGTITNTNTQSPHNSTDAPSNQYQQKYQSLVKERKSLMLQIQSIENTLKQLTTKLNYPQKALTIVFTNPQHSRKLLQKLKPSDTLSSLPTTITNLSNAYVNLLNSRQILHTKALSQQSTTNKTLNESFTKDQKELNEAKPKIVQLEKDKNIIEKNLAYKTNQIESSKELRDRVIELEQTIKGLTYFKQLVEQQEKVVDSLIQLDDKPQYQHLSEERGQNKTPPTAISRSMGKSQEKQEKGQQKNGRSQEKLTPSKVLIRPNESREVESLKMSNQFMRKYRQSSKGVELIEKLRGQIGEEKKSSSDSRQLMSGIGQVIQQFIWVLKVEESVDAGFSEGVMEKRRRKLQQIRSMIEKEGLCQIANQLSQGSKQKSVGKRGKLRVSKEGKDLLSQQEKTLSEQVLQLNDCLNEWLGKYSQKAQERNELNKTVSVLQLSNEQLTREQYQLQEMQSIFNYILQKKILASKQEPLPQLQQNQATITKNPQIVREIFQDQMKLKLKPISPITMLKRKQPSISTNKTPINVKHDKESLLNKNDKETMSNNNETVYYREGQSGAMSESGYSLGEFSMKTSRFGEQSNSIIETTLRLFGKINQIHIQYQDSIMGKLEESRLKHTRTHHSLLQANQQLQVQNQSLLQANQQQKLQIQQLQLEMQQLKNQQITQTSTKTQEPKTSALNQNEARLALAQTQLEELREKCRGLEGEKRQLEVVNKKLQLVKKQLQDQRLLLDKFMELATQDANNLNTNTSNPNIPQNNIQSLTIVPRPGSNPTSTVSNKSSSASKQAPNSRSSSASKQAKTIKQSKTIQQAKTNKQAEQKKQLMVFKRLYPKSHLTAYVQSMGKKVWHCEERVRCLEEEKEAVVVYYNELVAKMEASPQDWFKAAEYSSKFNAKGGYYGSRYKNTKANWQLMTIVREFTKEVIENRKELEGLSKANFQIATKNVSLSQTIEQLQYLQSSVVSFAQVFEGMEKMLKSKCSLNSKEKEELFLNELFLKSLLEAEMKKKKNLETVLKNSPNHLQTLNGSLMKLLQEISLIITARQNKKQKESEDAKNKLINQKDQLNSTITQLHLKLNSTQLSNKQLSAENHLLSESLKKAESSITQNNLIITSQTTDKSKQYQLERLKETIESYVSQETKLELTMNKLQKEKKDLEKEMGKLKSENLNLRQQAQDTNQELQSMSRLVESMKQNSGEKDNSLSQNQLLVYNLKSNYSKTEKQLQSIEHKIASLLQEKGQLISEKSSLQEQISRLKQQHKREKSMLQKELTSKRQSVQESQKWQGKVQKENQQLLVKLRHAQSTYQLQLTHQQAMNHKLEQQMRELLSREKREKDAVNKRIEGMSQQRKLLLEKQQLLLQNQQQHLQEYRLKLQQMQQQHRLKSSHMQEQQQTNKSTQVYSFQKQIQEISKNYAQLIKQYEKQKATQRQQSLKTIHEHEKLIAKLNQLINELNQQHLALLNSHQQQLNNLSSSSLQQTADLNAQLVQLKLANQHMQRQLNLKDKDLSTLGNERQEMGIKIVQIENTLQELTHKLQLSQTSLVQSQQHCLRLAPFQRKTHHYESVLLLNHISLSHQPTDTKENTYHPPKSPTYPTQNTSTYPTQNTSTYPTQNTLETRLNQLHSLSEQNSRLKQQITSLTMQLQKQTTEKQFLKHHSQLNRQDYIKLAADSKQQQRHLREENQILIYEKNILDNQLTHFKLSLHSLNDKHLDLQQQLRNNLIAHEKNVITAKNTLQNQFDIVNDQKDKTISEKTHLINTLEAQLSALRDKLQSVDEGLRVKEMEQVELQLKLKQTELKSKNHSQKQQILHKSQKTHLHQQLTTLKDNLHSTKFQLQLTIKDVSFYKASQQQKCKQATSLKYELQSLEKVFAIQKTNSEAKLHQLEHNMNLLEEQIEHNSRNWYREKIVLQSKAAQQIKAVRQQLIVENSQHQGLLHRFRNLQAAYTQKDTELGQFKKSLHFLQTKLQSKITQLTQLSQLNLNLDSKNKEILRTHKFQTLHLQAQLNSTHRILTELQHSYQTLQTELQQASTPFSPTTNINFQAKSTPDLEQVQHLHTENNLLKKNINSAKYQIQQLQLQLANSKAKLSELISVVQESHHLNILIRSLQEQLTSSKTASDQLLSKNRDLQRSNSLFQQELQQLHAETLKSRETYQVELEKYRNSQRVLDHQLIEYKSKLQNLQDCLKEQKQKTQNYKLELDKLKNLQFNTELSPKYNLKSHQLFETQSERIRLQNHTLQKKLITNDFQLTQLQESHSHQASLIDHLQREISALRHEKQRLLLANQSHFQFITSSNQKLHQLFSLLQNKFSSHPNYEFIAQTEFDLIFEVSNHIYQILDENKCLKNQCKSLQEKINVMRFASDNQLKHNEAVLFHLENLVQNLICDWSADDEMEEKSKENLYEPFELLTMAESFARAQNKLKQAVRCLKENDQGDLIQRYEKSIERIKKIIKLHIEQNDPNALQSLMELANS